MLGRLPSLAETFASCHTGYEPVERTGGKKLKKIKIKIKKGGGAAIRTERVAEGRKLKGRVNRKERAKRNRVRGPRRGEENKCERTQHGRAARKITCDKGRRGGPPPKPRGFGVPGACALLSINFCQ